MHSLDINKNINKNLTHVRASLVSSPLIRLLMLPISSLRYSGLVCALLIPTSPALLPHVSHNLPRYCKFKEGDQVMVFASLEGWWFS